jgi:CheY-like chemotaxis protein
VSVNQNAEVLYIEDSAINAKLMERIFSRHFPELQLVVAADGATGLRMLQDGGPSLVLLDCHLPDMSGLDVLRGARSQGNTVPVVAVTADARPELASQMRAEGVDGFITKPFDFGLLLREIQKFVTGVATVPQACNVQ